MTSEVEKEIEIKEEKGLEIKIENTIEEEKNEEISENKRKLQNFLTPLKNLFKKSPSITPLNTPLVSNDKSPKTENGSPNTTKISVENSKEEKKEITENKIKLNDRVILKEKNHKGIIRYLGKLENDTEGVVWIGIEWETEGIGKNDGMVFGKRYFQTKPNTGTFMNMETLKEKFYKIKTENMSEEEEEEEEEEDTFPEITIDVDNILKNILLEPEENELIDEEDIKKKEEKEKEEKKRKEIEEEKRKEEEEKKKIEEEERKKKEEMEEKKRKEKEEEEEKMRKEKEEEEEKIRKEKEIEEEERKRKEKEEEEKRIKEITTITSENYHTLEYTEEYTNLFLKLSKMKDIKNWSVNFHEKITKITYKNLITYSGEISISTGLKSKKIYK
jgi:hypothetical protein